MVYQGLYVRVRHTGFNIITIDMILKNYRLRGVVCWITAF